MARENVEAVYRRAIEAWNQGDMDGCLALMAEDIEVFTDQGGVEGGYRGHSGVRRWWGDIHDAFPDWHAEIVTLRPLNEVLLVQLSFSGHGAGSGVPVDQVAWHVIQPRDGRIARISRYETEAEALEAVGLSE